MRPLVLVVFVTVIFCGVFWAAGQSFPFFSPTESSSDSVPPNGGGGILPFGSGIRGKVVLGPACSTNPYPAAPECLDRPYETAVHVYRSGSPHLYALGKSDAKGNFEFSMPPGSYTVIAQGGKVLPDCIPMPVLVEASKYATTTISCDMGTQ